MFHSPTISHCKPFLDWTHPKHDPLHCRGYCMRLLPSLQGRHSAFEGLGSEDLPPFHLMEKTAAGWSWQCTTLLPLMLHSLSCNFPWLHLARCRGVFCNLADPISDCTGKVGNATQETGQSSALERGWEFLPVTVFCLQSTICHGR